MAFRRVSIPWKWKSFAFNIFDRMPMGEYVYYFTQKNITKTVPRDFFVATTIYMNHIETASKYFREFNAIQLLEIGAGWDLFANILNYTLGFDHQTVVDVRCLARAELVNNVIMQFQQHRIPGAVRVPEVLVSHKRMSDDLEKYYGIKYMAPHDARHLPISDDNIDLILTSSVLEHIPRHTLKEILDEFGRVLSPQGICSHIVDYSDHYAHSDGAINNFNFCTMSAREWQKHNPAIHFQNRMRHSDYVSLFKNAGFYIAEEQTWCDNSTVDTSLFHSDFLRYARADALTLGSKFVLSRSVEPVGESRTRPTNDKMAAHHSKAAAPDLLEAGRPSSLRRARREPPGAGGTCFRP